MPLEPEPARWRIRVARCGREGVRAVMTSQASDGLGRRRALDVGRCDQLRVNIVGQGCVEVIGVVIQCGVPQRTLIRNVGENAEGEDVRVFSGHGIHCVAADCRVQNRSSLSALPFPLLNRFVGVCSAARVGGEEHCLRIALVEADEGVLPVADVIAETDVQNRGPEIVGVEVEPEGVENIVAFVDEDEDCWRSRTTRRIRLILGVRAPRKRAVVVSRGSRPGRGVLGRVGVVPHSHIGISSLGQFGVGIHLLVGVLAFVTVRDRLVVCASQPCWTVFNVFRAL